MANILVGIFFVLHGLVHMFYFGQSRRLFDLRPDMVWPDGSWAFSRIFGDEATRALASISLVLATIGFSLGGAGLTFGQTWWRPLVVSSAIFSSAIFALFWDGKLKKMDEKGFVGILINLVILIAVLVFHWPS